MSLPTAWKENAAAAAHMATPSPVPASGQDSWKPGTGAEPDSGSFIASSPPAVPSVRTFPTGATRNQDTGKLRYEGFFSPSVLRRRAQFMHKHRLQSDGQMREPDNWQRGMDLETYADSGIRHMVEFWLAHRGHPMTPASPNDPQDIQEVICALMFNLEGYLHEVLKLHDILRAEWGS